MKTKTLSLIVLLSSLSLEFSVRLSSAVENDDTVNNTASASKKPRQPSHKT